MPRLDLAVAALLGTSSFALSGCANTPPQTSPSPTGGSISFEVHEGTKLAFDLSPDGRTIVIDLLGQLWTLPSAGGKASALTHAVRDTSEDLHPAIAPDGKQIAFRADRPGGGGIFLATTDDIAVRRIVADAPGVTVDQPAWAPDGRRLAFVRGANPPKLEIFDAATGDARAIEVRGLPPQNPAITAPAWSPDGSHIVFVNASSFQRRGGRIWEVPAEGGDARPWTAPGVDGLAPRYSPDARRIAFFRQDSAGRPQVAIAEREAPPLSLTANADVTPHSVRWDIGGGSLIYHADGRLWRMPASGGAPQEVPFSARVEFARRPARLAAIRFARVGAPIPARGFQGLALSPSGERIALIALDTLWVFRPNELPRVVTAVPMTAAGLSWSPDESEVTWSAGPGGAEDVFATRLADGVTRAVTSLPGGETRPSWSPDGRHIAFIHNRGRDFHLLAVPASGATSSTVDSTRKLGATAPQLGFFAPPQEEPAWLPDGRGIFMASVIRYLGGDSLRLNLTGAGQMPAFASWPHDSALYFINDELLWRRYFQSASRSLGPAERVSDDPAMYASVSREGSVLYVSTDGLRLTRRGRATQRLGWPLTRRVSAPPPLFISGVRLVGGGDSAASPFDILVRDGRIARIAPAGEMTAPPDAQTVRADGKWVMPGLIELHGHLWDDALLPGMLYYGVTSMRDMGSTGIARLAAHRDAYELAVRPGPRIVFGAIQFWGASGGLSAPGAHTPTDDAARARAVAMLRAFGADYLKMRWFSDWTGGTKMVAAAHNAGWAVSGHEAVQLPLVAAGIDGQEHFGPSGSRTDQLIYQDIVALYRATGMWVVPTIAGYASVQRVLADTSILSRDESAPLITPFLKFWQMRFGATAPASYVRFADATRAATRRARDGGVPIGAGSDAPLPWALHWELEELVSAGLTTREAIHTATTAAARILGAEGEIGSISTGAWADLVILDENPLEDIRNTRKIRSVIKGGRIVDRAGLLRQAGAAQAR